MSRRKNLHPQRAVNVKTVVVGCREEREEEEEEQPPLVLCLKIPDVEQNLIRKEETDGGVIRKGAKRKRTQHECDVCEKMFVSPSSLAIFTRTRNRTSVMCAIKLFVNMVLCKATSVLSISSLSSYSRP